jgi:phage terminase small subunit
MFALYCDLVDQAERARELLGPGLLLRRKKKTLDVKEGQQFQEVLVTNPAWRIYRDIICELRLLAREFGLTPSARSMMRLPESQTADTDGQL